MGRTSKPSVTLQLVRADVQHDIDLVMSEWPGISRHRALRMIFDLGRQELWRKHEANIDFDELLKRV